MSRSYERGRRRARLVRLSSALPVLPVLALAVAFAVAGGHARADDVPFGTPPSFAKSFAPNPIGVGGVSTLSFTIDNTASDSEATDLDFSDSLPAGVVVASPPNGSTTCTGGTLTAVAGSGTISYTGGSVGAGGSCTVDVDVTATTAGDHLNTSGELTSSLGNSGTASETLSVLLVADLAISKDDGATTVVPGDPVTYTITVSNSGPSDAIGAAVADTFPAALTGVTWTCAATAGSSCTASGTGDIADSVTILAGGSLTYTATGTVDPGATGALSNTATVVAPSGVTDPDASNDSATDTDTLSPEADLSIGKSDSPDPVASGNTITYTITVSNLGPSDAEGVVVTDSLPAGVTLVATAGCAEDPAGAPTCTLGTMPAGGSGQFTIQVSIDPAAPASVRNTASVSADTTDPDDGNNSAIEVTTIGDPGPAPASCAVYGVDDVGVKDSQFFTVEPFSPFSQADLGPLHAAADIEALDIDPFTGRLYATAGNGSGQKGHLFVVDGADGSLHHVAATGQKEIEALSFRPTDGVLWGWGADRGLFTIDTTTGVSTLVLASGRDVEGLAWNDEGTILYAASRRNLFAYDPAANTLRRIATNLPGATEALAMRPDGLLALGVHNATTLYAYDPVAKQAVTDENIPVPFYGDVEGLAWPPVNLCGED